jgi:hypothetical protein
MQEVDMQTHPGFARSPHLLRQAAFAAAVISILAAAILQNRISAAADVGIPPWPHQAGLVNPGDEPTNVQMVREEVTITVEAHDESDIFPFGEPAAHVMLGHADARFWMRNQGQVTETFKVWFPLWIPEGAYRSDELLLRDLQIRVDGRAVGYEFVDVLQPEYGRTVPWGMWTMSFPPGDEVEIRVTYNVYPIGDQPLGTFQYILETGADWYGTIGEGTVTIELPYPVQDAGAVEDDISTVPGALPVNPSPDYYEISGNRVTWRFADLEPAEADNISLTVLAPRVWEGIQSAYDRVQADPGSAGAYNDLAIALTKGLDVIKGIYLTNAASNPALARAAKGAYEEAYRLTPEEQIGVEPLVGYLRLLFWMKEFERHAPPDEWVAALEEALQRNPEEVERVIQYFATIYEDWGRRSYEEIERPPIPSEASLSLIETVDELAPGELDWLRGWIDYARQQATAASPTLAPIRPPTVEPEPAQTEESPSGGRGSLCPGSLAAIPLAGLGVWTAHARKRKGSLEDA